MVKASRSLLLLYYVLRDLERRTSTVMTRTKGVCVPKPPQHLKGVPQDDADVSTWKY